MIPRVYGAINAVATALSTNGIAKERLNARDDYFYRSIDDVLSRLSPLLAEHRLCILPRVLERTATDRTGETGELLVSVTVRCAFNIVSAEDGSTHVIEMFGEALDASDKGTAKAMQSAYKYAMLQAFCVPAPQAQDADGGSYRLAKHQSHPAPAEGWPQWAQMLQQAVGSCSTPEDLTSLQEQHRQMLASLSRERPELYKHVGETVTARRGELVGSAKSERDAASLSARQVRRAKSDRSASTRELRKNAAHA